MDGDVDQQRLGESAGGDSLPNVPVPGAPLPEAPPDGSVGEQLTSRCIAEEEMCCGVRVRIWFISCSVPLFVSIHPRH